MKNLLLLLIFLAAEKGCDKQESLPLLKATSQAWSGGAAGSGRGTYYTIYLRLPNSADYTFDSLWVQGRRLPVTVNQKETANDTLVLSINDMTHNIRNMEDLSKSSDEIKPIPIPVPVTDEDVLGYHYKGQQKYLLIESWIKLKPLYYP